jgi:hypothetical protein
MTLGGGWIKIFFISMNFLLGEVNGLVIIHKKNEPNMAIG